MHKNIQVIILRVDWQGNHLILSFTKMNKYHRYNQTVYKIPDKIDN